MCDYLLFPLENHSTVEPFENYSSAVICLPDVQVICKEICGLERFTLRLCVQQLMRRKLQGDQADKPFCTHEKFVIEKIGNGELTEGSACIMAIKHKMKKTKLKSQKVTLSRFILSEKLW